MSDFTKNLELVVEALQTSSVKEAASKIGMNRSTLSRLLHGERAPSRKHLSLVSTAIGIASPEDLLGSHEVFRAILAGTQGPRESALHSLTVLGRSVPNCAASAESYQGQYILYSPSSRANTVIASLLSIGSVTPQGLAVKIINPYNGHDGDYLAFEYKGFCVPVADYLYLFGEQVAANYEVTNIIFHNPPILPAMVLEGVWSGIGVRSNRRFVSSSLCVGVRIKKDLSEWRSFLGTQLGYVMIGSTPRVVQMKFASHGTSMVVVS